MFPRAEIISHLPRWAASAHKERDQEETGGGHRPPWGLWVAGGAPLSASGIAVWPHPLGSPVSHGRLTSSRTAPVLQKTWVPTVHTSPRICTDRMADVLRRGCGPAPPERSGSPPVLGVLTALRKTLIATERLPEGPPGVPRAPSGLGRSKPSLGTSRVPIKDKTSDMKCRVEKDAADGPLRRCCVAVLHRTPPK